MFGTCVLIYMLHILFQFMRSKARTPTALPNSDVCEDNSTTEVIAESDVGSDNEAPQVRTCFVLAPEVYVCKHFTGSHVCHCTRTCSGLLHADQKIAIVPLCKLCKNHNKSWTTVLPANDSPKVKYDAQEVKPQ